MNGKVYTLNDIKEIFDIAKQEYEQGWWGIVVPTYIHDQMLAEIETINADKLDKHLNTLFTINVIINDEIVQQNGGHCMFVDREFGRQLLDMQAIPYDILYGENGLFNRKKE